MGWLADRSLPRFARAPLFKLYARAYGVELDELRLPLAEHKSFGAFFVRRLRDGARPLPSDARHFPSPCDGTLQAQDAVHSGTLLQAKGRPYPVAELLGACADGVALEGGRSWTIYLSPRDYHRVHSPVDGALTRVDWLPGDLFSVQPRVLERRARVLSINERAVLRLDSASGPLFLVMVGALNVGRIRVVGVEPGRSPAAPRALRRGEELARFELGSTVVLVAPPGVLEPLAELAVGAPLRLGQPLARARGPL